MKIKRMILSVILIYFLVLVALFFSTVRRTAPLQLDVLEVNHITQTLAQNWEVIDDVDLTLFSYDADFVVLDSNGQRLAATRDGLNMSLAAGITNRDTMVNVVVAGEVVGNIIFYNDSGTLLHDLQGQAFAMVAIILTLFTGVIIGYLMYLHRVILQPFQKLEGFAKLVAAGNLDLPLVMDKEQIFGAFTESFDLMREELHKARENERKANESKKELVAQLSHDIKTPIASIKAVSELMHVLTKNEKEKQQLEVIRGKAEQINALITDLFHTTLEELKTLPVAVQEIESQVLSERLQHSDYKMRIRPFSIPNALIEGDPLRIAQIFDNIVTNIYKYAKTDIQIEAYFKGAFLIVEILDFGPGVATEELPLLLQKFYRGSASETEVGYGLGLHISNYLMEQMAGKIKVENRSDGFTVRVFFKLAGVSLTD